MAVITVYQNGVKAGMPPAPSEHQRAKRKAVQGWSEKSTRENLAFLRSVKIDELTGLGHCVTLTVKTCPESAAQWAAMRKAYFERLRRAGVVRLHWVTEWQKRGVPHLHGIVYFADPGADQKEYRRQDRLLREAWLKVVAKYGADRLSQQVKPVSDELGWCQYLAKHAARGAKHYQRAQESIPASWAAGTGRIWGRSGNWPVRDPMKLHTTDRAYWEFRRMVRGWRLADARSSGDGRRISSARGMLRCWNRSVSEVRGVSEWITLEVQLSMLAHLRETGHTIIG